MRLVRVVRAGVATVSRFVTFLLISTIKGYQLARPLLGPCCRFHPSCSDYSIEAFHSHGVVYGLFLTLKRLLKCHPGHPGGFDWVPTNKRDV